MKYVEVNGTRDRNTVCGSGAVREVGQVSLETPWQLSLSEQNTLIFISIGHYRWAAY